jgi:L-ascorbate metabolism protein UlaG (beta-lactamase superfamily)
MSSAPPQPATTAAATAPPPFTATYFGANGWLLEMAGLRVLVDPWLVGSLVFPPGPWLFHGEMASPWPIPEALDLLLLTQGLPDHCHLPTLEHLDRRLPVLGSPQAAARVRALGFEQVEALSPGQSRAVASPVGEPLRIEATAGAAVPVVENGYLLSHSSASLYLEPHGFLPGPEQLPPRPLDAVITPVVDLGLPLAGAFVKGRSVLPELVRRFQPRTVLASTSGGEVRYSGLLSRLLWQKGSAADAGALLQAADAGAGQGECRLIDPVPGQPISLSRQR